ncbi:MAG: sensor histidine kinase [Bradymonadales bacterium]|nr:MAG: sensor histidine kinase [Bradymonadales bacterium]
MSESIRFSSIAREASRKLSLRFSILGFLLVTLVAVTFLVKTNSQQAHVLITSLEKNFAHDIVVGDHFQITRRLDSLLASNVIVAAWIHSQKPSVLVASQPADFEYRADLHGWHFPSLLQPVYFDSAPLLSTFGEEVGRITFGIGFPANVLVFVFIGLIFFFLVVSASLRRGFTLLADRLTQPLESFARQVEGADAQSGLQSLKATHTPILELEMFRQKLFDFWSRIEAYQEGERRLQEERVIISVAKQVSHDIRSPVSALRFLEASSKSLESEEREIIRSAIGRIKSIADDFLKRSKGLALERVDLPAFAQRIDTLIVEKKLENANLSWNVQFERQAELLPRSVSIQTTVWDRILSNLLNNCIEARKVDEELSVRILLSTSDHGLCIVLEDNAKGIPPNRMEAFSGGEFKSYGKKFGHGLGLTHAREHIRAWNGSMKISSEEGHGTKIEIFLPFI